jgi:competence protein CoiA
MKYALINGDKSEATKGAKGFCSSCGAELIAKCGEVKVNHWAHKGGRNCDPWWENETDWHRLWKGNFPVDWQEVIHFDGSGEKHIADVKTQTEYVLEFQHSFLNPEERNSRNTFYSKLVWIVDGTRRKTDKIQFKKAIEESAALINEPLILRILFPEECRLLKEWQDSNALVFFDFQETTETNQSMLWFLFPKITTTEAYLSPFSKQKFIEMHNENKFDEIVRNIILPIHKELADGTQIRHKNIEYGHPNRFSGFDRFMANSRRRQRRF